MDAQGKLGNTNKADHVYAHDPLIREIIERICSAGKGGCDMILLDSGG